MKIKSQVLGEDGVSLDEYLSEVESLRRRLSPRRGWNIMKTCYEKTKVKIKSQVTNCPE